VIDGADVVAAHCLQDLIRLRAVDVLIRPCPAGACGGTVRRSDAIMRSAPNRSRSAATISEPICPSAPVTRMRRMFAGPLLRSRIQGDGTCGSIMPSARVEAASCSFCDSRVEPWSMYGRVRPYPDILRDRSDEARARHANLDGGRPACNLRSLPYAARPRDRTFRALHRRLQSFFPQRFSPACSNTAAQKDMGKRISGHSRAVGYRGTARNRRFVPRHSQILSLAMPAIDRLWTRPRSRMAPHRQ